jgi:hypothetical protein
LRSRSTWILSALAALALLALVWLAVSLGRGTPAEAPIGVRGAAADSVEDRVSGSVELEPLRPGGEHGDGGADFERVEPALTGATLTGRVTSLDGAMDLAAVRVALWAERTAPICAQFAMAGPRTQVMRLVRAASDGTFAIEDLDPGTRYHLRAGGGGRASLWLPEPVAPGGVPVVLELARVKGLRVELVGTDGKPPRTPPELLEDAFVLSGSQVDRRGARLEPWEQELVGIPGTGCDSDASPYGQSLLLSSPPQFEIFGPITCFANLPGYHVEQPTFWAPLAGDRLHTERLILRASTSGFGTVEFELAGLSDALRARIAPQDPLGSLHIEFEDSSSYMVKLFGPAAVRRLDGLPTGPARWAFESYDVHCRRPIEGGPIPFRIGDQVTHVAIDLSQTGGVWLELDPASRTEAAHLHHATFTNDQGQRIQVPAERLPRLFLLIEAGEWRQTGVAARDPKTGAFLMTKLDDGPSARILPGEIATLRVTARGLSVR